MVLDEVEKAHRDVLDVFLNVFDEGYFYDANKRKIDFTNSIIIMTSNLGFSEEMFHKNKVGYVNNIIKEDDIMNVISKHFRPEFLNRIDEIIHFENLSDCICKKLINKYIDEYQKMLDIEISREIVENNTLDDKESLRYGARGIRRKVKKEILKQIDKLKVYKM